MWNSNDEIWRLKGNKSNATSAWKCCLSIPVTSGFFMFIKQYYKSIYFFTLILHWAFYICSVSWYLMVLGSFVWWYLVYYGNLSDYFSNYSFFQSHKVYYDQKLFHFDQGHISKTIKHEIQSNILSSLLGKYFIIQYHLMTTFHVFSTGGSFIYTIF